MNILTMADCGAEVSMLERGSGDLGGPLRAALASCRSGGGIVTVPAGTWTTGPLDLPSDTTLRLEDGATLRFAADPALYPPVFTRWEGVECHGYRPLLRAADAENVTIEGRGVIDGGGAPWWRLYRHIRAGTVDARSIPGVTEILELNAGTPAGSGGGGRETGFLRPPLLQFRGCRNVHLAGPVFINSPFWNTHILYSADVRISGCTFRNPSDSPNTDGLNIDSSTDVKIENCLFDVGDDCLCLKSGSDSDGRRVNRPTRDVLIRGCEMHRGHGAVVMGSEISGGIRDVRVESCRFTGTDRGIRIKARRGRGGYVRNLSVSDIDAEDVRFPLVINLYYRCGADERETASASSLEAADVNETTPEVGNISLKGIRASGVRTGAFVSGLPESPVRSLSLTDWHLGFDGRRRKTEPAMDFQATRIPPTGFYGRRTRDVRLEGFRIDDPGGRVVEIDSDELPVSGTP